MDGVIDLSFDDETFGRRGVGNNVISLIDDGQENIDGGSSTAPSSGYSATSSISTVQSKKRRRASKNVVARSPANNVNKSSSKKPISESKKQKIKRSRWHC